MPGPIVRRVRHFPTTFRKSQNNQGESAEKHYSMLVWRKQKAPTTNENNQTDVMP
jgi:hypothetical protein